MYCFVDIFEIGICSLSLIYYRPFWWGRLLDWAIWNHVQKATKDFKWSEPTYRCSNLCLKNYWIKTVPTNSLLWGPRILMRISENSAWEKLVYSTSSKNWISKYRKSVELYNEKCALTTTHQFQKWRFSSLHF